MSQPVRGAVDPRVQQAIGNLLRTGVVVAALVTLIGAVIYLLHHGQALPSYRHFHAQPSDLRHPGGIVQDALAEHGRGIIQLGLILLVATPVSRVAVTVIAFALERDRAYVVIALIVLALLLGSLFG